MQLFTSAFFLFNSNACARRSFSAGLEYVDFGTLGIYKRTHVERAKISGTKCTITTIAMFHTETKLVKKWCVITSWIPHPGQHCTTKWWMRNGVAQHNVTIINGTLVLFTMQLGRQQKSNTLAITLVSIKIKHVPFVRSCHTYSWLQAKTSTPTLQYSVIGQWRIL